MAREARRRAIRKSFQIHSIPHKHNNTGSTPARALRQLVCLTPKPHINIYSPGNGAHGSVAQSAEQGLSSFHLIRVRVPADPIAREESELHMEHWKQFLDKMADRYPVASSMLRCKIRSLLTDLIDMDNRIRGNILDPRILILQDSVDANRDFLSGYVQCLYDWEHIDVEELSDLKHELQVPELERYRVTYCGKMSERMYVV